LRHTIAITAIGSMAVCLLAAGCGGGDGDSIDKASFVEQANAICKEASAKMKAEIIALGKKLKSRTASANVSILEKAVIPALQSELDEIQALGIPSGGKKEVEAFLAAQRKVVMAAEAQPAAFFAGKNGRPWEAAELAATRYGISECPVASAEASS
jgi:hypothetical protein